MSYVIQQMGYVVVGTPNVRGSAHDLADILCVRLTTQSEDLALLSSNSKSCEVAYVAAAAPCIVAVGLEVLNAAAVEEVTRRVTAAGMEILADHSSVPDVARAVRFRTPFGPIFEAHTPVPRDGKTNRSWPDCRARRLDHINLRVSDPRGFHDFLTGTLEMRLSDRTSDYGRAWYRTADGFHHTIAAGVGTGFHHFGFDAPSVQDLISVADKLHSRGRTLLWGIGRHGPGDNIFTYYAEPNGCVVETSFGMERIDRDDLREPGVWSAEYDNSVLDLWGSKVPEAYAKAITPFAA